MNNIDTTADLIPANVRRRMLHDQAWLKKRERENAERWRAKTQRRVDDLAASHSTGPEPDNARLDEKESRREAGAAAASLVYKLIEEITAQSDMQAGAARPAADLRDIRIDDLTSLFRNRMQMGATLRRRIEKIHAKVHWTNDDGDATFFNKAVHKNNIPLDKLLCILAHMSLGPGVDGSLDPWIETIIECGLFTRVHRGKHKYARRCQNPECDFCNYVNPSDGIKTLAAAYDEPAFRRGGHWFWFTISARNSASEAKATGRVADTVRLGKTPVGPPTSGEHAENRTFAWPSLAVPDELPDYDVQKRIRAFLGAGQLALGKLVKDHWLDGIRARVEDSVEFLPYRSHQHWHAVGSSCTEHDPQAMAEKIKEECDAVLEKTCPGVYADVLVSTIPSAEDLYRYVKYMNKGVDLVRAVDSVYNRYPAIGREPARYRQFRNELSTWRQRTKTVFQTRFTIDDERGMHTYCLRKRYVGGNHRFRKGSILSETERHRFWREEHARRTALKRKEKQEAEEDRVSVLLSDRAEMPWPKNSITVEEVRGRCGLTLSKARAALRRMKSKGVLMYRTLCNKGSGKGTRHYMPAAANVGRARTRSTEPVVPMAAPVPTKTRGTAFQCSSASRAKGASKSSRQKPPQHEQPEAATQRVVPTKSPKLRKPPVRRSVQSPPAQRLRDVHESTCSPPGCRNRHAPETPLRSGVDNREDPPSNAPSASIAIAECLGCAKAASPYQEHGDQNTSTNADMRKNRRVRQ